MSGRLSSEVKAEPNLTPILDMVFQLITFFVLVINFKTAELDVTLKLPVVGSARPVDTKGQLDLLVLNIDHAGNLRTYGHLVTDIAGYIRNEAQTSMLAARMSAADLEAGGVLPTTVVIRADRAISFKMLNRVIKACQDAGFQRFFFKALNKEG